MPAAEFARSRTFLTQHGSRWIHRGTSAASTASKGGGLGKTDAQYPPLPRTHFEGTKSRSSEMGAKPMLERYRAATPATCATAKDVPLFASDPSDDESVMS